MSQWRLHSKRTYNRVRKERQQFNEALATLSDTMGGQRHVEMVAPMVNKDKRKGTYIIPLSNFEDLKSNKSRTGEVQALRIMKRTVGTKYPAQGFLYFPGALEHPDPQVQVFNFKFKLFWDRFQNLD